VEARNGEKKEGAARVLLGILADPFVVLVFFEHQPVPLPRIVAWASGMT
jgi:hypothetical protein